MVRLQGDPIDGVVLRALDPRPDERGTFLEIFRSAWLPSFEPAQWSVVRSRPNTLRGPHLHLDHDESFLLVDGKAFVGLRDLRPESPSQHRSCLIELDSAEPTLIVFPRGLLHGWYFPVHSLHVQSVSEPYDSYHPHDNLGCRWDDPELQIAWPCSDPIVSERQRSFPSLSGLLERIGAVAGTSSVR